MKRFYSLLSAFLLCAFGASAEDLFVRPSGGTGAGTSWTAAWNGFNSVQWGSGAGQVGAGDTLWVAGGSYTPFTVGASGATIKRATTNNVECTGAAGWSAALDDPVIISVTSIGDNGIWIGVDNVTVDGQTAQGIKIDLTVGATTDTSDTSCIRIAANGTTLRYLWLNGLGDVPRDTKGLNCYPVGGGSLSGITVQYCEFSGVLDGIQSTDLDNWLIEYCTMHAMSPGNGDLHGNLFYNNRSEPGTIRYCEFWDYEAEGIYFASDRTFTENWYIYGNIFRDTRYSGRGIEWSDISNGPEPAVQYGTNWYVYNNTFVNITGFSPIRNETPGDNGGPSAAGGYIFNNIFYNCAYNDFSALTHDYNWYGGGGASEDGQGEANQVTYGSDPFVSLAGKNFRLSAGTTAGKTFESPYDYDPDGIQRGGDTVWDRGAFEFNGTASAPSIASNNFSGVSGVALTPYQISATGTRPMTFGATNLPSGLVVNVNTGIISGTPTDANGQTNTVGLFATNSVSPYFDVQTVQAYITAPAAVYDGSVSTFSFTAQLTNTTSGAQTLTIQNAGAGTLTGYVASVSAGFAVTPTNYSVSGATTTNLSVTYTPTTVGTNQGSLVIESSGTQTITLYGSAAPNLGLHAALAYGLLIAPMTSNANNWVGSTADEQGTASFFFDLPVSGYYTVQATTSGATNGANNSFYVSTKTETEFIWDIFEEADGLNYVHNRGTGLYNAPQYTNYAFTNLAGQQWLQFRGREICYLSNVVINFTATGGSDVTPPDTYTFNYPTNSGFTVTTATNYTGIGGTAGDSDGELLAVYWTNATTGVSGTATGTTTWTNYPVSLNQGLNTIYMRAQNTNSLGAVTNIIVNWPGSVAPVSGATLTGGTLKVGQ